MAEGAGARANYKFGCGTPQMHCMGGTAVLSSGIRGIKVHTTRGEAFKCHARWLKKVEGYTQIGPREFSKPGHPVRVLTKKIRFGAMLRPGKEGRNMPKDRPGGFIA
jgi:hypothetical protein